MLLNLSYNSVDVTEKINAQLGQTFSIKKRAELEGTISPILEIMKASITIHNFLILNPSSTNCTITLRPKGIIICFRAFRETYALPIPYYKLRLNKTFFGNYTLYKDHYYITVLSDTKAAQLFFRKLIDIRSDTPPYFL